MGKSGSVVIVQDTYKQEDAPDFLWMYTDGACSGNPGPGGWGVLLKHPLYHAELSGRQDHTTNNRMELTAVIKGLEFIIERQWNLPVKVVSDSQYVIKGITEWAPQWQRNGWRTSQRTNVENRDLWEYLLSLTSKIISLSWQWVRGHAGDPDNEAVDQLAQKAMWAS